MASIKALPEYVQLEEIDFVRQELREMNYKLVDALNSANIISEMEKEKRSEFMRAKTITKAMLPEVRELIAYLTDEPETPTSVKKKKGRPLKKKTVEVRRPHSKEIEELKKNLQALKKSL